MFRISAGRARAIFGRSMRGPWLAALLLTACSGHFHKTVNLPKEPLELTTVFVYPFGFRWPEPAYRSFELSQRLIDVAAGDAGDKLVFYGPTEFRVLRDRDNSGWVSTTALERVTHSGEKAERVVMLRPWAERRVTQTSSETVDQKGKVRGGNSNEETLYLGHVEVVHPSSREVLVEVTGEAKTDPFAEASPDADFDPAPVLTALMARLTSEAIATVARLAPSREVKPDFGLKLALSPSASLAYKEEGRPSGTDESQALDPVAQELFVDNRARMLAPFLTDAQLAKVEKAPLGLFVAAAPAGSKLLEGDVITQIDGGPPLPQRLYRLRFAEVPVQLQVQRGGAQTEIVFP